MEEKECPTCGGEAYIIADGKMPYLVCVEEKCGQVFKVKNGGLIKSKMKSTRGKGDETIVI
uniref:Uncharacterized protein n=1 Tax=viral metagenome TaxID=1070528 RepID=A0A6H1ZES6_9ZZZZ